LYLEDKIIVELKSVETLVKQHEVQLVNYLKGLQKDIGLLINFGPFGVDVKRKYRTSISSSKINAKGDCVLSVSSGN